jgi:AcrR family transcriptional regulator
MTTDVGRLYGGRIALSCRVFPTACCPSRRSGRTGHCSGSSRVCGGIDRPAAADVSDGVATARSTSVRSRCRRFARPTCPPFDCRVCITCNYEVMANQIGLRERRRRQTSADIRDAAVRLARERGFDRVTIEEICVEAGISPRTFFNYFPNKESAIAYGPSDIPPELVADFVAAGPAPYSVVLAELITLAAHHLRDMPPAREQAEGMLELAKTTPAVLAAFLADLERFQNHLTDIVARRQAMRPDDEIPALISALALTAVRSGIERWSSGEPQDADDTPMPYVERAAALVNSIFTK